MKLKKSQLKKKIKKNVLFTNILEKRKIGKKLDNLALYKIIFMLRTIDRKIMIFIIS